MNYLVLQKNIDAEGYFLILTLYDSNCITKQQMDYLRDTSRSERNAALLDILMRRSSADFMSFIKALNETGQQHIARLLDEETGKLF